jgi:radical SAM superfamily enzyme YgiQ (UPF0313 family)
MGRGPYLKTPIANPPGLKDIQRTYCRYGILPKWFLSDLKVLKNPDLVLVTSVMTYWYPGVQETIAYIRKVFSDVPIVLGGIYATLWPDHARKVCGADQVIEGMAEAGILELVKKYTGFSTTLKFDPTALDDYPYPSFQLEHGLAHVPLQTSRGCPFRCSYCASGYLQPRRMVRSPDAVVDEIIYWHKKYGVIDFVFYDDALLVNSHQHAVPLFESILKSDLTVRFHTPNAVHVRGITAETARLLYRIGTYTLRLGLETTAFENRNGLDCKVTAAEFFQAVLHLKRAGFDLNKVGAYLLTGLPGQSETAVKDSIKCVKKSHIRPVLAQYTPIPHTALWDTSVAASRYDLNADPIFSNNAVFPCQTENFSWDMITRFKRLIEA